MKKKNTISIVATMSIEQIKKIFYYYENIVKFVMLV